MPRVDDARVYAHTVLFFTFSSPLLSLAAFALRARSSIPSPLQHLFQQTRGGGGEFKKLALRILFFFTTKRRENSFGRKWAPIRRKKGRKGEENMETVFWRVPRGRLLFFFFFFFMFINASYVYRFHSSKRDNDTDLCQLSLTIPFRFSFSH